jgi:ATP-dependent 26S proteasome regulatory subunit
VIRKIIWFVAIVGWILGISVALVDAPPAAIVGCVVAAIATWITLAQVLSYIYGIRRHANRHVAFRLTEGELIKHTVHPRDRVDVQKSLDLLAKKSQAARSVFGVGDHFGSDLMQILSSDCEASPLEWESRQSGPNELYDCLSGGVYLLNVDEGEVVMISHERDNSPNFAGKATEYMQLEILASGREVARKALDEILAQAASESIYKGAVLSLQRADKKQERFSIKFHRLEAIEREQIVLPEAVLEVVDRNVLGFLAHRETLRNSGRKLQHGVLFHGPPGTGKTLATKYLAARCEDYTVLLVTGWQLSMVRETFALARRLAPAMIILEDVDLIATRRRRNQNKTMLHELLDEMDGLASDAEIIILMTTNNPSALEPALAMRPGRVDQAILFPLPDSACRERLLTLFGKGLVFSNVDTDKWIEKTAGSSPAFLEELLRKAVLFASERDADSTTLVRLTDDDLEKAMRELILFGGKLTQKLLGFSSDGDT